MRYAALLRHVNVGGKRLSMDALRGAFEAAGATDVATYVQSGDAVFDAPRGGRSELVAALEREVEKAAGFSAPVILRTAAEMRSVIERNPWPDRNWRTVTALADLLERP